MAKPMLISPISKQGIQLIRVAAYCRVSSSSADQLNSYATQIDYYTKLAKKKKSEWNMVEIFADEGLSGMKANTMSFPCGHFLQFWAFMGADRQQLKDILSLCW